MSVAIVACKCQHDFQDKKYGKGLRVANVTMKSAPSGNRKVRCTVCSTEQEIKESQVKK